MIQNNKDLAKTEVKLRYLIKSKLKEKNSVNPTQKELWTGYSLKKIDSIEKSNSRLLYVKLYY